MSEQNKSESTSPKGSRIDPYRHLVGVLTDSEVAIKAGVSSSAVHQYRNRLGIAPALPQGTTRRALDRRRAREASGEAKPSRSLLSDKSADEVLALHSDQLGRMPDRVVASQIGVTVESVQRFREKLGLPEAPDPSPRGAAGGKRGKGRRVRSKLDPHRDLVGVLSDSEVAKRAGVTRSAVQMYRRTHGIPAASPPGGGRPAVATSTMVPLPSRPIPASGRSYAWLVRFATATGEQTRVVVAGDAAVACATAESAGEVLGVERLAEALG